MINEDLPTFVRELSKEGPFRIYKDVGVVTTVYESLDEVAQATILRLIFVSEPIGIKPLAVWTGGVFAIAHSVVEVLADHRIVTVVDEEPVVAPKDVRHKAATTLGSVRRGAVTRYKMNESFSHTLQTILVNGSLDSPLASDAKLGSPSNDLSQYAIKNWENLLQYVVSGCTDALQMQSTQTVVKPCVEVVKLLEDMLLLSPTKDAFGTNTFQWLMKPLRQQVVSIVRSYLHAINTKHDRYALSVGNTEAHIESVLKLTSFICQWPTSHAYPKANLNRYQLNAFAVYCDLGLVLEEGDYFYITPRACLLRSRTDSQAHTSEQAGGMIVESNFKVFAYIASPLQIALISKLCSLLTITPFLVVGLLSRQSIGEAFRQNITAEQVISFFRSHPHASVLARHRQTGESVIPENVLSQIRMWGADRQRVSSRRVCLVEFTTFAEVFQYPDLIGQLRLERIWFENSDFPDDIRDDMGSRMTWARAVVDVQANSKQHGFTKRVTAPYLIVEPQHRDMISSQVKDNVNARSDIT